MTFKILAIDGGGIRGLIPALMLAALEDRTGRPICELFDLIAGTSTGGILALGVTKPGADGKVEHSAQSLIRLYEEEGGTIFPHPSFLSGPLGLFHGAKYSATGIEQTLVKYFGETHLKEALKPVLVSSYDIEKQTPIFFKSEHARTSDASDFRMRDVARATSAAPTYFPPAKIETTDLLAYYSLIDGGVVAGNPAMCAYAEAVNMGKVDASGVLMVSLGTGELQHPIPHDKACAWGQLEWAQPIIDIVLQASNATVDYQLQQLLPVDGMQRRYYRFQPELSEATGQMDNTGDGNLRQLRNLTETFLGHAEVKDDLDQLCKQLTS
jgi:uncharacterized protein